VTDTWEAGHRYEPYVGRWSRLVARRFLQWLAPAAHLDWLDVGCGTGAVTDVILRDVEPRSVTGIDASAGFVEHAAATLRDPRARFEVADAESLPAATAQFDVAVGGLMLNFVREPSRAVGEMVRVVRPGGVVAAYVWDYAGRMDFMRHFWDAAVALDRDAAPLDEGHRFPICRPGPLVELFAGAGLRDTEARAIDIPTRFRDFDDYWSPFLGGQGPAPGYVTSLDEARQAALRARIRASLPVADDGSIALVARAWAVRGRVP
jgi:SAM-dependent methyltransferase